MRISIVLGILLLACGCSTRTLGPQKPPEPFVTPRVTFVAEATGRFEDAVKKAVLPTLRAAADVERAYLVRVEYPDGATGMCLCLTPSSAESMDTAEAIGSTFGVIAEKGVYLDIMFINNDSLRLVDGVAEAFYVRP